MSILLPLLPVINAAAVDRVPTPLARRGGVAAGASGYYDPSVSLSYGLGLDLEDSDAHRSSTAFDNDPPSSTYRSGPKIAGSTGGFYGLLFGLLVLIAGALLGVCFWRRRRRQASQRRTALNESIYPSAKGAGVAGLGSKKAWGKHQELSGEDDSVELRGSRGDPWASTASVNLQPEDGYPARYKDSKFAESGDSLAFDSSPRQEYHPVAGGQLDIPPLELRTTSPDVR